MRRYLILWVFIGWALAQQKQLVLPVKAQTHQKLSLSLKKLSQELQYFRTPYENKSSLYKNVAITEQYLRQVNRQLYSYDNVVVGQGNTVDGHKNVIVGSYNTISGSNNFVFVQKYQGQANGDLLIGKWRIQIQKKQLILINASMAISFLNQEENRKYLNILNQNRRFSYGSTLNQNFYTVINQKVLDKLNNQLNKQYLPIPQPSTGSSPNTGSTRNNPSGIGSSLFQIPGSNSQQNIFTNPQFNIFPSINQNTQNNAYTNAYNIVKPTSVIPTTTHPIIGNVFTSDFPSKNSPIYGNSIFNSPFSSSYSTSINGPTTYNANNDAIVPSSGGSSSIQMNLSNNLRSENTNTISSNSFDVGHGLNVLNNLSSRFLGGNTGTSSTNVDSSKTSSVISSTGNQNKGYTVTNNIAASIKNPY